MAIIGEPIDRLDGKLKVTGRATYAAEFKLPGLVHAVLVQSTIANGAVLRFDLEEAKGMPGVLAIITPENALRLGPGGGQGGGLLQNMNILYNGQNIAIVVADTLE